MISSSQSFLSIFVVVVVLFSPIASVVGLLRPPPNLSMISVERLIHDLNLFPNHPINIVDDEVAFPDAARLVERRFRFPNSVDPNAAEELGHHAGYYKIEHSNAARMFYFFFESRNSTTDPVVIWLTGGPGCSSEMALFYENGPFTIADNLSLVRNEYGWDQVLYYLVNSGD